MLSEPHLALEFRFFWVSCEGIFTTETQRGYAATEIRNISRKGAKAQRKSIVISNEERNLS